MASVLAIGALSSEACQTTIADFLVRQDRRARLIKVRVITSHEVQVGLNEWRPQEDEDLGVIGEQIAGYIAEQRVAEHRAADAIVLVRSDAESSENPNTLTARPVIRAEVLEAPLTQLRVPS
jgi:hypothetical protein